jgi:hypothetical protein
MRCAMCALVLFVVTTARASAECIAVPTSTLVRNAEILMLARVDAAPNPSPEQPNFIDGTFVVTVTVKTLWKGSTPRQIQLRQTYMAEGPPFWENIGNDLVLSVRRLTTERPLDHPIKPPVTSGFTAEPCSSVKAADLDALGRGRSPDK